MQTVQADYLTAYLNLKLTRDADGVLVVEFHSKGGPCIINAQGHTEVVDAFYRIGQDRANKIGIFTGAGGEFIIDVDWSSFGDVSDPGAWSQVHDEGVQALENIANKRVPVVAAGDPQGKDARSALVSLCESYWYPLYTYLRRRGYPADEAQDLTQDFFVRVLEGRYLDRADPEKGRFRSFILTSLKFFVADEKDRYRALKRGGGTILTLEFSSGEEWVPTRTSLR
jgi:Sigma-70 region 2